MASPDGTSLTGIQTNKKNALIISVSNYDDKKINQIDFCKKDGERMRDTLYDLGFNIPESNKLIGEVDWQTMRDTISDFFTQRGINSKDTLLFYFSGHGLVYNDKFYLATSEIDPYQPYKRGIEEGFLKEVIDDCPSKKIVMILDSCHSGMLNPFSKGDDKSAASVASDTVNKMNMAEGRFLLASCKGSQESFGAEDGSKFTQYVIEGLQGNKGSIDKDGHVTPDSLSKYIYDEMMDHPEKDGTIQRPIIKVEGSGDIVLAAYPDLAKPSELTIPIYSETLTRGNGYFLKGAYDDAIKCFEEVRSINPNEAIPYFADAWYRKGNNLYNTGKKDEAFKCYDKAIELDPNHMDAWHKKGNVLMGRSDFQGAISCYNNVLQINPNYGDAWNNKGVCLFNLGKFNESLVCYDRSLSIRENDSDVWANKGLALEKIGKLNDAKRCFTRASELR